jgi:hypothetical protein
VQRNAEFSNEKRKLSILQQEESLKNLLREVFRKKIPRILVMYNEVISIALPQGADPVILYKSDGIVNVDIEFSYDD